MRLSYLQIIKMWQWGISFKTGMHFGPVVVYLVKMDVFRALRRPLESDGIIPANAYFHSSSRAFVYLSAVEPA